MKSRLKDDSISGNLEGMIADKFLVDAFQPKNCDEKDVMVVAFLVSESNSAAELCDFIAQGPFQFLNVEASRSPDEDGNYVVLVEISRNGKMVEHLENLLKYIDQLAHVNEWYFQPYGQDSAIAWSSDRFNQCVPQNPDEFTDRKSGHFEQPNSEPVSLSPKRESPDSPHCAPAGTEPANINYQALEKTIAKQISKANQRYIKEFAKQHRKVITENRRLLKNFDQLKSDYNFLYEQLAYFQEREKLGLLREQQDAKRIRDLENRFSFMLLAQSKSRKIPYGDAHAQPIEIERIKEVQPITGTGEESEPESVAADSSEIQDNPIADAPDHVSEGQADDSSSDDASAASGSETNVSGGQPEAKTAVVIDTVAGQQPQDSIPEEPVHDTPAAEEVASMPSAKQNSTANNAASKETSAPKQQEPAGSEAIETDLDGKNAILEFDSVFDPVNEYLSMGIAASKRNEYHSAIECFKKVTVLAPKDQRSYYNLAVIYYRRKDYNNARQYAKQALALGADAAERIIKTIELQTAAKKGDLSALQENRQTVLKLEDFIDVTPADGPDSHGANKTEEEPEAGPNPAPQKAASPPGNQLEDDTLESIAQADTTGTSGKPRTGPKSEPPALSEDIADTVEIHPGIRGSAEFKQVDQVQASEAARPHEDRQDAEKDSQTGQNRLKEAPVNTVQNPPTEPLDQGTAADKISAESGKRFNGETAQGQTISEPDGVKAGDAAPEPKETIDYFAHAMAASERKDYAEAIVLFNKSLEQASDKSRVYYNLAVLNYRLKDYSAALSYAKRAVELGATAADPIVKKAERKLTRSKKGSVADIEAVQTETTQVDTFGGEHPSRVAETQVQPPPPRPENETPAKETMSTETVEITETDLIEISSEQAANSDEDKEEISGIPTPDGESTEPADPGAYNRDMSNPETAKGYPQKGNIPGDGDPAKAADENGPKQPPTTESLESEPLPETPDRTDNMPESAAPAEAEATAAVEGEKQTVATDDAIAEATPSPEIGAKEPSKDYFALAMAASERKEYSQAITHFNKFIAQTPDEPRGYYNLAVLHYRLKDYPSAIDCAKRAVDLGAGAAQKIVEKSEIKMGRSNENKLQAVASNQLAAAVAGADTTAFDMIGQDQIDLGQTLKKPSAPLPLNAEPAAPQDIPEVDLPPIPPKAQTASEEDTDTLPEFPTLTGEIFEAADLKDDQERPVRNAQQESYPEIGAVPMSDPGAVREDENVFESSPPIETSRAEKPPENAAGKTVLQDANSSTGSTGPGEDSGRAQPGAPLPQMPVEAFAAEVQAEKAAKDYFALGQDAYARKDYGEAIELFNLFIERYPDEPRGYYNLAVLHYRLKDFDNAEFNAQRAFKLGAKAAKQILQKVEKKRAATAEPNPSKLPAAAAEPEQPQAASGDKPKAAVSSAARPHPVDKQASTKAVRDDMAERINELPTTTINISEALGEDTVVWDADELEEAGPIENTSAERDQGKAAKDDVILFEPSETEAPATQPVFSFEESDQLDMMAESFGPTSPDTPAVEDDAAQEKSSPVPGTEETEIEDDEACEYFALGLAASDQREYLKAIQYFTKFTNLSPEDPRGFYNLAVVSYRLKFYETALEHAKHSLELGSEHAKRLIGKIEAQLAKP